jgi:hypothetical protein
MISPLTLRCVRCGHSAPLPGRVADLAGKTLKCSKCGARQRLDLQQVIAAIYAEETAAEGLPLH